MTPFRRYRPDVALAAWRSGFPASSTSGRAPPIPAITRAPSKRLEPFAISIACSQSRSWPRGQGSSINTDPMTSSELGLTDAASNAMRPQGPSGTTAL